MSKPLALTLAGLASLLASGCSLPSKAQWAEINQHGLLPVLIDGRDSTVAANTTSKPSEQSAVKVQAVTTPVVVKTPSATPVAGRAGYAYSPHTTPRKVVDVRGYQPGEEVRCPFTGQAFLVPAVTSATVAESRPRTQPRVTDVVSNDSTVPAMVDAPERLEPVDTPTAPTLEPAVPPVSPAPPAAATAPVVKAKPQVPYGTRVAGRPGFVYSPFAAKTQLVDVAGTAPGVIVKCPYTNKVFRVPEMAGEEVKPSAEQPAPAANTAGPGPETPAPAPAESTPPTQEPAPTIPGPSFGSPPQP